MLALAEGRSEPVEATVDAICRFFIENDSEYANLPLAEALVFYATHWVL